MTERPQRAHDLVRQAFLRASQHGEPDIERLVAAVPSMLEETARLRRQAGDPAARISAAAFQWLPRLAAATVLLVVAAAVWPARGVTGDRGESDVTTSLEYWLGHGESTGDRSDPVLDALTE